MTSQFQTQLFINNEFVDALDGATFDVFNPFDNSLLAKVAEAKQADIDRAVAAARKAFPAWAAVSPSDRGVLIGKLADAIEKDRDNLSLIETLDTGHPIRDTRNLDVLRTVATFRYFAGMPDKNEGTVIPVDTGFLNYVTRVPVGVVGQVVPWNFPLMFTSWKLGPALAAGNCVVMKQAELTPLSTLRVAELAREVGFPPGVINIVPGYGHIAGQYLAEHRGVDKISFTGSTATGRKIVQASAGNLKRVQLELGGKGANIVFEDANITAAVNGSAFAIFHNQGQACIAGSRLMLHEKIADEFLEQVPEARGIDQARQSARSEHRDGSADLEDAPGARAELLQGRAGRRRRDAARRQGARRCGAAEGLLRRAHDRAREARATGCARKKCSDPSSPCRRSRTTKKCSRWPTTPSTASAAACGPTTCSVRT